MTLVEAGKFAEARAVFEKRLAQQKAIERGSAQRSLGQLALFQGNINAAADHFDQAALLHESANAPVSAARDRLWWAIGETARRNNKQAGSLLKKAENKPVGIDETALKHPKDSKKLAAIKSNAKLDAYLNHP